MHPACHLVACAAYAPNPPFTWVLVLATATVFDATRAETLATVTVAVATRPEALATLTVFEATRAEVLATVTVAVTT